MFSQKLWLQFFLACTHSGCSIGPPFKTFNKTDLMGHPVLKFAPQYFTTRLS